MIESPATPELAADEFIALLAMEDSEDAYEFAYALVGRCFEEIFQNAYLEALHTLTSAELVQVLTRAAMGADSSGFHVSWILHRLLQKGDPEAIRAYIRWSAIDPADSPFRQSSTEVFFVSVAACAFFQEPFTTFSRRSKNHEAWRILAEVVYLMNYPDQGAERGKAMVRLWQMLIASYAGDVIEPLMDLYQESFRKEQDAVELNVWRRFPDECRRLLENVVRSGVTVSSIHQWTHRTADEVALFVFGRLAALGDRQTLELLRPLAGHVTWGVAVVDAIRGIEAR
jgi:hypothetical protein